MAEEQRAEQKIVEDFRGLVKELVEAGEERTKLSEFEATAAIQRYHQATEELEQARATLERFRAECEELPAQAYKANMDGSPELEASLRERYCNLQPEIGALEERVEELEAEIRDLLGPNSNLAKGTHYDVMLNVYGEIVASYAEAIHPLRELEQEVTQLLRQAIGAFDAGSQSWSRTIAETRRQRLADPEVRAMKRGRKREKV